MTKAIQFKDHWVEIPQGIHFYEEEPNSARLYLEQLSQQNIDFTYPGDLNYPKAFYAMKEPPLFLEYQGPAIWKHSHFISVVGSRELAGVTELWMKSHLSSFLEESMAGVVSGGARGVDQLAHLLAMKAQRPTVMVLPSGLQQLYPPNLRELAKLGEASHVCLLSEFERDQKIHKSHFYFRNRLIAALGHLTLVTQASLKSGSLLTVHHCLENGKPVSVVPAHPEMIGFDGSLKLLREGAFPVQNLV
jgi:DNA processing protein